MGRSQASGRMGRAFSHGCLCDLFPGALPQAGRSRAVGADGDIRAHPFFLPWPGPAPLLLLRPVANPKGIPAQSPAVARNELPWENVPQIISNRNAVAAMPFPFPTRTIFATTALRLNPFPNRDPR